MVYAGRGGHASTTAFHSLVTGVELYYAIRSESRVIGLCMICIMVFLEHRPRVAWRYYSRSRSHGTVARL